MTSPNKSPLYARLFGIWMLGCGILGAALRNPAWRDRVSTLGLGIVIVFGVLIGLSLARRNSSGGDSD